MSGFSFGAVSSGTLPGFSPCFPLQVSLRCTFRFNQAAIHHKINVRLLL